MKKQINTNPADMMNGFQTQWMPGGMSLYHSGHWLCFVDNEGFYHPIKFLGRDDG